MRRPSFRQGFISGLLLVFMPPVGLICFFLLLRDIRAYHRSHGEVSRSVSAMLYATDIAPGAVAEPRRPREREAWTRIKDYVH